MQFDNFSLGSVHIDGSMYEHDIVIDRGAIRKQKPSKKFRDEFGHTPLSVEETYLGKAATRHRQWCIRQIIGDARSATRGRASKDQVVGSANRRSHQGFRKDQKDTNAILHVTC